MTGVDDFPSVLVGAGRIPKSASWRDPKDTTEPRWYYAAVPTSGYLPEKSDIAEFVKTRLRDETIEVLARSIMLDINFRHELDSGKTFSIINLPYALTQLDDRITTEFRPLTPSEMSELAILCDGHANKLRSPYGLSD
ncbi:MAG: hypothetical protein HYT16_00370 [DPANN group archaeon]|nr:hypothetical protein [DPANN group archaeon]